VQQVHPVRQLHPPGPDRVVRSSSRLKDYADALRCSRRPTIVRGRLVNASPSPDRSLSAEELARLHGGQLLRENKALRKRIARLRGAIRELDSRVGRPLDAVHVGSRSVSELAVGVLLHG
jgi:hypothetical protein